MKKMLIALDVECPCCNKIIRKELTQDDLDDIDNNWAYGVCVDCGGIIMIKSWKQDFHKNWRQRLDRYFDEEIRNEV